MRNNNCEITIREAGKEDIDKICEMLDELFQLEKVFKPNVLNQRVALNLLMKSKNSVVFVLMHGEEMIATCSAQTLVSTGHGGFSLLIDDLIIAKNWRRKGIGKRCFDLLEEWARERGMVRMQLLCGDDNRSARDFCEKNGWSRTDFTAYFKVLK